MFYTGHTDDLERRIGEHKSGLVRGFTQDMHPLELVWTQEFVTRDEAKAAEIQIKGWSRRKKLALIRGDWAEISRLAKGKSGPSTSSGQTGSGVRIIGRAFETLISEAQSAAPEEACGLLFGREGRIEHAQPTRNVHSSPQTHFEIDPQALIDAHRAARRGGADMLGYYHSHPTGPAEPSATDRALASGDGRLWAIVGQDVVTFWRDDEDGFAALSYTLVDG